MREEIKKMEQAVASLSSFIKEFKGEGSTASCPEQSH